MATTMQDVARYAAVSTATVSRALNKPELVDEATRQRVLDAVKDLGYRIDAAARTLRTRRTQHLAVVVDSLADPLTVGIIECFEDAILEHDYTVQLYVTQGKENRLQLYLRLLAERGRTDGVLWMSAHPRPDDLKKLSDHDIPVVMLNVSSDLAPALHFDYAAVARHTTRYLLEQGHRRVGLIANPAAGFWPERGHAAGYQMALAEVNIPLNEDLILEITTTDAAEWSAAALNMLSLPEPPSALVTSDDRVAAQVYQLCAENAIRIPDQLSVVGCGDLPIARFLHPLLTSVQLPTEYLGRRAFKTLQAIVTGAVTNMDYYPQPAPRLIERASVARL
jgi:DNA-binding LacI/PurR family transcriptional regulator